MAQPWLDDLSEDWDVSYQQKSSSPVSSRDSHDLSRQSINSNASGSRIPLRTSSSNQSRKVSSTSVNSLRPRSSRGLARPDTPVLSELSLSNLNVTVQPPNGSNKSIKASSLPRRVSGAFNNSVSSVQHHTIHNDPHGQGGTPEWKRRLHRGEKVEKDLFGPSPLEGIFQNPSHKQTDSGVLSAAKAEDKPWTMPVGLSESANKRRISQSMKSSRIMAKPMEILEEEMNEASTENGRVALRSNPEDSEVNDSNLYTDAAGFSSRKVSQYVDDPRQRTISGQEEIRNEAISPITLSKQNTINERLLQGILGADVGEELNLKLQRVSGSTEPRPLSRASDNDVQYGRSKLQEDPDSFIRPNFAELTSHSLPDDLSMGTDDFASRGGFINTRRGGYSDENSSFLRRNISSFSADLSRQQFRSSPPPYVSPLIESASEIVEEPTLPETPSPKRPQNVRPSPEKSRSSGSPLKLFGDYDTYTKDRLSRRLSQFEIGEDSSKSEEALREEDGVVKHDQKRIVQRSEETSHRRMSQFGQGHLNDYPFTQSMAHESSSDTPGSNASTPPHPGTIFKEIIQSESTTQLRPRKLKQHSGHMVGRAEEATVTVEITDIKRGPSSPGKERTPKRRRTLLREELESPVRTEIQVSVAVEDRFENIDAPRQQAEKESTQIAGQKRKDAKYEGQGPPIDPNILASRQILRPRSSGTRRSSRQGSITVSESQDARSTAQHLDADFPSGVDSLTHAVANELASFRENFKDEEIASPVAQEEIRKPSITTQDYFAEATKVMELIRQNKKPPKSPLRSPIEPRSEAVESSVLPEVEPVDDFTSTLEQFSRPPSREGGGPRPLPRKSLSPVNPRVISHLRKFEDEAADEDEYDIDLPESDPPNLRIRAPPQASSVGGKQENKTITVRPLSQGGSIVNTSSSRGSSSGLSIPTGLSGSSGDKGFITSEHVKVPTQVGEMIFDEVKKSWVPKRKQTSRHQRKGTSEEDPFENIPDLSVDELEEARRSRDAREEALASRLVRRADDEEARPVTRDGARIPPIDSSSVPSKFTRFDSSIAAPAQVETRATSWATVQVSLDEHKNTAPITAQQERQHANEVEHEIQIHEGRISKAPSGNDPAEKQPRVVTIAFSSPLVSGIVYRDDSMRSVEQSPSLLDMNSVNDNEEEAREENSFQQHHDLGRKTSGRRTSSSLVTRRNSIDQVGFIGRPVSRIDEEVEDQDMSLIHRPAAHVDMSSMTPIPLARQPPPTTMTAMVAARNDSSPISLTPLSEFTFNQRDSPVHLDHSYVATRTHPTSLQQAHGQLSLAVDDMVRAITDVEPYEPYWDHIHRLDLSNKSLQSLHRLADYCPRLEELSLRENKVSQITELPSTLRTLDLRQNCLTELCAWSNLANLQYLDVSGNNGIETLEGFKSLKHLRDLRVNECGIRALDSLISETAWDGLLKLTLKNNQLAGVVDFEGAGLDRLVYLDLSQNNIAVVKNLHSLPALTHLDLSANQLKTFESAKPLEKLRVLKLSWNQLRTIDLGLFPSLQLLYLDGNCITSIDRLGKHRNLEVLSLRSQSPQGPITKSLLESILCTTPSDLRKLYLSANPLPPSCAGVLPPLQNPLLNLQYLDIASCGISSLPPNFGKQLPNLRALNMSFNALGDITALKGIVRLNKLLCIGNRLQRMRRTIQVLDRIGGSQGNGSLTKIDFRGNGITAGFYVPWDHWGGAGTDRKPSNGQFVRNINPNIHGANEPTITTTMIYQHEKDDQDAKVETKDPFTLPPQSSDADQRYLCTLDEGTRLKRGIWELLLMDKCPGLKMIDGLDVPENWSEGVKGSERAGAKDVIESGGEVTEQAWVWRRLFEVGVLKKVEREDRQGV